MAAKKKAAARKKAAAKKAPAKKKARGGFTDQEKAAMKERAREIKAEAKRGAKREEGEKVLLEAIAEMPRSDKTIAKKVHAIVAKAAPDLMPKTWYGMPAYANADGKVVVFFQGADKFESRYATVGFNDAANLDDGDMWPTTFAVKKLTESGERKLTRLVKRAVS